MIKYIPLVIFVGLLAVLIPGKLAKSSEKNGKHDTGSATNAPRRYTSIDSAQTAANEARKPLFILITGTAWCQYSKKLESELLSTREFQDWASTRVILYVCDLKRPDAASPECIKLMQRYGEVGVPAILFTDANGKELGRSGYAAATPAQYLGEFNRILGGK